MAFSISLSVVGTANGHVSGKLGKSAGKSSLCLSVFSPASQSARLAFSISAFFAI